MTSILRLLGSNSKYFKVISSIVLIYGYYLVNFGYGLVLLIIGFTYYAYITEMDKIAAGDEYFKGDNIFFRYGKRKRAYVFPIHVKEDWTIEASQRFADGLIQQFIENLNNLITDTPMGGKHVVSVVGVFDQNRPKAGRGFLKSSFKGANGAMITNFLTYQMVGKMVALHHETYSLGISQWYDRLFFFVSSPVTIVTWIYQWFTNVYSIRGQISSNVENSFELYDLDSFYSVSVEVVSATFKSYLIKHDLLTEGLAMTINNFGNFNQVSNYGGNNFSTFNQ